MDKIFSSNDIASTSECEKKLCDVIIKKNTSKVGDNNQKNFTKCVRTSSGNSSFTAGTNKREISRFSTLNRSFNNASSIASDFRRKIYSHFNESNNNNFKPERIYISNTKILNDNTKSNNNVSDTNNLQTTNLKNTNSRSYGCEYSPRDKVRSFSQRVKHQVQSSLSDPTKDIKLTACESLCGTCSQCKNFRSGYRTYLSNKLNSETSPLARTSSVRKTMAMFSNRLQLPKFMTDKEKDENKNDGEEFVIASSSDEFDDPELYELREREQIVEKYEKGPNSKDVDPWENPDFELYKVTDRYGFVHGTEAELQEELNERRKIERDLKREQKWLRMLDEWKQRHPAKLPERIWKGVPEKLRLVFWKKLLGVDEMKNSARANLYNELLMRARLISKDIKQIDLDINRTYRDHLAFRRRYDVKQQSLFNVLSAYAMFNTEVGYCQGMSQIAAVFLMYMDEEDAFWCLHSLLANRKYSMHGFFVPGFPKLLRFQNHYEKVIQKYLPRDKVGIPNIHLTKWWFGCFLDRVPFSLAIRVWDVFLYYGDCILIVMAYNIIKMHRKTVLKFQLESFMDFIQHKLAANFGYTNDQVMESLQDCLKRLQSDRMALPPPPNPNDLPELPVKPLGPILTRSMVDIRMDIAEIQSRCSRANSVAGRSPAIKRYQLKQSSSKSKKKLSNNPNVNSGHLVTTSDLVEIKNSTLNLSNTTQNSESSTTNSTLGNSNGVTVTTSNKITNLPIETFSQISSIKNRNGQPLKPPPVPDADGFVPISPRHNKQRVTSCYDNLATSNNFSLTQNNYSFNQSSLKTKNEISDKNSNDNSLSISSSASIVPSDSSNNSEIKNTLKTPSTNEKQQLISNNQIRRSIGSDSFKQRQPLSQVVKLYHKQYQQQQEYQKNLPNDFIEKSLSDKDQSSFSTNEEEEEKTKKSISKKQKFYNVQKNNNTPNIIQTSNNITYVSINYDANQQQPIQQRKQQFKMQKTPNTSFEEKHHTPNVMPYCPPPDYDTSSGESRDEYDSIKHLSSTKKVTKTVDIQRVPNTGGSLQNNHQRVSQNSSLNIGNNAYHLQSRNIPHYDNKDQQYITNQSYMSSNCSDKQQQQQPPFYDQQQQFRHYSNSHQLFGSKISQPLDNNQNCFSNSSLGPKYYPGDTYSGVNSSRYDNKKSHLANHSYLTQQKNMNNSRWYYDYPVEKNDTNNRWGNGIGPPPTTNYYHSSNQIGKSLQQHYSHKTSQHNRSPPLPITMPLQSQHHQKQQSPLLSSYHDHNQLPNNNTTIIRRF